MAVTNGTGTSRRYGNPAVVGSFAALLLVAVCGSPAYVEWAGANTDPTGAGGWYLRVLAWPAWQFGFDDVAGVSPADLTAILLVVLAAGLLHLLSVGGAARTPGATFGQFLTGWGAYALASGFAGFLGSLIGPEETLLAAFTATGVGVTYGFFAGWIVGVASLGGRA
jgi:hypothetical protein